MQEMMKNNDIILHYILGGGLKHFLFLPLPGKWSNLTNIFQTGWNHQLYFYFYNLANLW